jgi:hypothetical protein
LTFSDSSSAVIFPNTTANYGTGSFTVEMAFKPTFINGRHYLMSKNSGSFPNWAIYLSGSNGSGKLWSEFRPTAAISCSVSSSTTFVTGTVYQVDVRILPGASASGIYVNGQTEGGVLGNGGGTLTSTASLFVGNYSLNNTQNFSGSIYAIKTYLQASTEQPVLNYNATSTRFSKPPVPETAKRRYEILVVAGGGSGGRESFPGSGGGGGAGGLQYTTVVNLTSGVNNVIVGAGGVPNNGSSTSTPGDNSSLGSIVAFSGGRGGARFSTAGIGGSGGGGSTINNTLGASGTSGQGNAGSSGGSNGGGGGGAGAASLGRIGGSGSYIASFTDIGGSPAGWFAGGGTGGSGDSAISGGIGGGGIGGGANPLVNAGTGSANTGGGGGGGAGGGSTAAAGGSGIVAIRYSGGPIALGGEITQSGGFTYHVYRTVGTSSFTIF